MRASASVCVRERGKRDAASRCFFDGTALFYFFYIMNMSQCLGFVLSTYVVEMTPKKYPIVRGVGKELQERSR